MRLSQEKRDKIAEQILSILYHIYPQTRFVANLSSEIARDEEFIKALMFELRNKNMVVSIKQNPKGKFYSRRLRWRLTPQAYQAYKQHV